MSWIKHTSASDNACKEAGLACWQHALQGIVVCWPCLHLERWGLRLEALQAAHHLLLALRQLHKPQLRLLLQLLVHLALAQLILQGRAGLLKSGGGGLLRVQGGSAEVSG